MNIALVDDEKEVLDELKSYVEQYGGGRKNLSISTYCFSDPVTFLDTLRGLYDIIFLDIEMPYRNGMSVAEEIRKTDENVILIFVTNMAQYAVRGYSVHAYSFLVKPVDYGAFAGVLDRAIRAAGKNRGGESIMVKYGTTVERILVSDILYVEVYGHKITYHLAEKNLECRDTMKAAEETLRPYGFSRCHYCYLVNPKYIRSVGQTELALLSGEKLPVAKSRKDSLMEDLAAYQCR